MESRSDVMIKGHRVKYVYVRKDLVQSNANTLWNIKFPNVQAFKLQAMLFFYM